jgi:hypothetical protein
MLLEMESEASSNKLIFFVSFPVMTDYGEYSLFQIVFISYF